MLSLYKQILTHFIILITFQGVLSGDADYNNQGNWPLQCLIGKRQSPINIQTTQLQICTNHRLQQRFFNGNVYVNPAGAALKNDFPASYMKVIDQNGKLLNYQSLQYHWHYPSEHAINGQRGDLEVHFVHQLSPSFQDQNYLSVIGVIFQQDQNAISDIFDNINFADETGRLSYANFYQLFGNLIQGGNYYHYKGSLTTPGCDQVVNWFVSQRILPVKPSNLQKMKHMLNHGNGNSRDLQNLNDRQVTLIMENCRNGAELKVQLYSLSFGNHMRVSILIGIVGIALIMITF